MLYIRPTLKPSARSDVPLRLTDAGGMFLSAGSAGFSPGLGLPGMSCDCNAAACQAMSPSFEAMSQVSSPLERFTLPQEIISPAPIENFSEARQASVGCTVKT